MIDYIIYNDAGDILRTGKCPENMINSQRGQGEYVMQGIAKDDCHKIEDGNIVDKVVDNSIDIIEIRQKRNILLSQTDWTQMPDSPLTEEEKQNYRIYRQSLRDLPAKYDTININEVTFPILGEI